MHTICVAKAMFRWPPLVVRLRGIFSPRNHRVMNSLREAMTNWELTLVLMIGELGTMKNGLDADRITL